MRGPYVGDSEIVAFWRGTRPAARLHCTNVFLNTHFFPMNHAASSETAAKDAASGRSLRRTLTARHLTMIALGGSIGTGLFVASGAAISQAGPGGALLAYGLIGLMVYFLMTGLGELAAFHPVAGCFAEYGERYVDKGFGFALGINYCYNWAVAIAVDLVAAEIVMGWWFPDVPGWYWSALFLSLIFGLNYFSARTFGEAEFWFAAVKVATVVVFVIVGLLMIAGIIGGHAEPDVSRWANWTTGDAPFAGGLVAFMGVAMVVGYSFQGTDLVAAAAGESANPKKNIPLAVRQIFWRILLFYVCSIFVIGTLIAYTDPRLLKNDITDIAVSPFTLVFEHAGLLSAAAVMNAVILTTVLSAGNSGMFAAARMLYVLAEKGQMPKIFAELSPSGVPRNALWATTAIAALCFLTSRFGNQTVYLWLLNTTGMGGFILWLGIAAAQYRFRRGFLLAGGDLEKLPYKAPFYPFGPIFAFTLCAVVTLGQNYSGLISGSTDLMSTLATYIGLIIFAAL